MDSDCPEVGQEITTWNEAEGVIFPIQTPLQFEKEVLSKERNAEKIKTYIHYIHSFS